jgi:hypothetical protein
MFDVEDYITKFDQFINKPMKSSEERQRFIKVSLSITKTKFSHADTKRVVV